jgi:hypothetical protein
LQIGGEICGSYANRGGSPPQPIQRSDPES